LREAEDIRDALKSCPAPAVAAALRFRATGDIRCLPAILRGIIGRHVTPDLSAKLASPAADDFRLVEDLGVDSLMLIEIAASCEEVFQLSIPSRELFELRTLGDINRAIAQRLCCQAPPGERAASPADDWD